MDERAKMQCESNLGNHRDSKSGRKPPMRLTSVIRSSPDAFLSVLESEGVAA